MVDTGAGPNLIKKGKLKPDASTKTILLRLTGITDGQVGTLGTADVRVLGEKITLHVVSDDFPMSQDGILGSEFLWNTGRINFVEQTVDWRNASFPFTEREQETIQIPARSNKVLFVKVTNAEIIMGYVPRL